MTCKILGARLLCFALVATAVVACGRQSAPVAPPEPAPDPHAAAQAAWTQYAARFIEDYFKTDTFFAVQSGRHEFDGQITDLSADGIAKKVEWLNKTRGEAADFDRAIRRFESCHPSQLIPR